MKLATARFDWFSDALPWRCASVTAVTSAGMTVLVLGLLLPDRFAAPLIGIGLTALLLVRLHAMGTGPGALGHARHLEPRSIAALDVGAPEAPERRVVTDGWHPALVDDALDDSFQRATRSRGPCSTAGRP